MEAALMCPCQTCGGDDRNYRPAASYGLAERVARIRLDQYAAERGARLYKVELLAERSKQSRPVLAWTRAATK